MSDYDPNYVETRDFYRIGVKIAIINNKNEVLLLRRSGLTPHAGTLDLPGGAVDANEAPATAIIRETVEETGIVITDPKIVLSGLTDGHADPWMMLGFGVRVDEPEVALSWEHDAYTWTPLTELDSSDLHDGYKEIIRAYTN